MTTLSQLNSHIGLRTIPLSYGEYTSMMYNIFVDKSTLVLLDTNVLAIPFGFHAAARTGFYKILNDPIQQKRLKVPAWASNEFFYRAMKMNPNTHGFAVSAAKLIGEIPATAKVREFFPRIASDADIARIAADHGVPTTQVMETVAALFSKPDVLLRMIGAELDAETVHAELDDALKDCHCALDFNHHCGIVDQHADRRRANRIPPGLTDGDKSDLAKRGKATGNVDGDLALWLEILTIAKNARRIVSDPAGETTVPYENIVILSEERKPDFLYTPKSRLIEPASRPFRAGTQSNKKPDISLIDPRLVSEFEAIVGHRNIAFANLENITDGLFRANPTVGGSTDIKQFARALTQLNETIANADASLRVDDDLDLSEATATSEDPIATSTIVSTNVEASEVPALEIVEEHAELARPALLQIPIAALENERQVVESLSPSEYKEIVDAINTRNWYVQNPAVLRLLSYGLPADLGASFVTGRAIYQAADGSAWRAANYLETFGQRNEMPTDTHQAFLAGAAAEIFFDHKGAPRIHPKASFSEVVLNKLREGKWQPALEYIRAKILATHTPYWVPGDDTPQIYLVFTAGPNVNGTMHIHSGILRCEGYNDVELVVPQQDESDFTNSEVFFNLTDLKKTLQAILLIPEENIHIALPADIAPEELEYADGFVLSYLPLRYATRTN